MYIEKVEIAGFGGLPLFDATLGRATRLDGSPRALVAFQDALLLAFGSWDAEALRALLDRWGCVNPVIAANALPEGAQWESAPGLGAVLDRRSEGLLTVGLTVMLDPPQFGKLRRLAARDARLVDALADGARLTVRVGARFSPALDAVAIDPIGFVLGNEAFPIAGAERPAWMTPFLQGLAGRLWRGLLPGAAWGERARSYRAEDHRALARALAAMRGPPAALGEAVALPEGPAVFQDDALVPLRHLGPLAEQAAGLVGAVFLSGADVLVVEHVPAGWEAWLEEQAEAENSPVGAGAARWRVGGVHVG